MKRIALLFLLFCNSVNAVITEEQLEQKLNGSGKYADFFSDEIAAIAADSNNFEIDKSGLPAINPTWVQALSDMLVTTILYLKDNESLANNFVKSDLYTENYKNRKNGFLTQYKQLDSDHKKKLAIYTHSVFSSTLFIVCKYAFSNRWFANKRFKFAVRALIGASELVYKTYVDNFVPMLEVVCKKLQASLSSLDDSKKHKGLVDLCDNYESYIKNFAHRQENFLKKQQYNRKIDYTIGASAVLTVACGVQSFREKDKQTRKRWIVGGVASGSVFAYALWKVLSN